MNQSQKIYTVVGATSILAVSGIVGYVLFATPDPATAHTQSAAPAVVSTPVSNTSSGVPASGTPADATSPTYKDGTYTAKVNYPVPEDGVNSLTIQLTVVGGKVTAVKPSNTYQEHESVRYIDRFNKSIAGAVVGESIDNLSIGRVGGASLTSSAFNDVLDTIRNEAHA